MDIVIYTTPETLEHKKGKVEDYDCYYWEISRPPVDFEDGEKIFFAVKGQVVGYFFCEEFNPDEENTLVWDCHSWVDLKKKIPTKPFRGFRYRWFEDGDNR